MNAPTNDRPRHHLAEQTELPDVPAIPLRIAVSVLLERGDYLKPVGLYFSPDDFKPRIHRPVPRLQHRADREDRQYPNHAKQDEEEEGDYSQSTSPPLKTKAKNAVMTPPATIHSSFVPTPRKASSSSSIFSSCSRVRIPRSSARASAISHRRNASSTATNR